jgi:hypothetical protein
LTLNTRLKLGRSHRLELLLGNHLCIGQPPQTKSCASCTIEASAIPALDFGFHDDDPVGVEILVSRQ